MKLVLNERTSLDSALAKVEVMSVKLGFDQIALDTAKGTVMNFHSLLTSPQGENVNSTFEKVVKGSNGKKLKIKATSSSQQGFVSRLFSV